MTASSSTIRFSRLNGYSLPDSCGESSRVPPDWCPVPNGQFRPIPVTFRANSNRRKRKVQRNENRIGGCAIVEHERGDKPRRAGKFLYSVNSSALKRHTTS